jgi:hypothetical protein
VENQWAVYGDNILECWRFIQYAAPDGQIVPHTISCDATNPVVRWCSRELNLSAKLVPSPDRIPLSVRQELAVSGVSLREQPDVVLCREGNLVSTFEFCSALPAGNNAWQRHGRSLSLCMNGVSHFHIAKIGGYELDANRVKKAPRLPNPLVLISYLRMSSGIFPGNSYLIPLLHDDCPDELEKSLRRFDCKGDIANIVCSMMGGGSTQGSLRTIRQNNMGIIKEITSASSRAGSLSTNEWLDVAESASNSAEHLMPKISAVRKIKWSKSAPTNKSKTGRKLQNYLEENFLSLGSSTIPICFGSAGQIASFIGFLEVNYERDMSDMKALFRETEYLLVTCDSGFKPRGDDSRPARGLTPFAKSLIHGDPSTKLLVFLYGPCKLDQWRQIKEGNLSSLARTNGLWESVYTMADYLVLDSESHPHPLLVSTSQS